MPLFASIAFCILSATLSDTGHDPGSASNPLCGRLPVKTLRWGPSQGALHLSGTVVVGPGQTMILAAGTQVLTDASTGPGIKSDSICKESAGVGDGTSLMIAGGSLFVRGSPGNPVVFRPAVLGADLVWGGLSAEGALEGTVDLAWLEVHQARTGAAFVAGSGEMRHVVIENCGIGIAALAGATPRVLHCVVSHSSLADVVSERSAPLLRSCLFLNGQGDAIRFKGTGLARVQTSCFWGHRGTLVVRGPVGLGEWKGDSLPDKFGNWNRDPILRGSATDRVDTQKRSREVSAAPWWKHSRMPDLPPGSGPWALSAFSPLLEAGERGLCRIPTGTRCDIGLWSGL